MTIDFQAFHDASVAYSTELKKITSHELSKDAPNLLLVQVLLKQQETVAHIAHVILSLDQLAQTVESMEDFNNVDNDE